MTFLDISKKLNTAKIECRQKGLDVIGYRPVVYLKRVTVLDILFRENHNCQLSFSELQSGGVIMGVPFRIGDFDRVVIEKEV